MKPEEIARQTCMGCRHIELSVGSHGYSKYTPGYPGEVQCVEGHWSISADEWPKDEKGKYLSTTEAFKRCMASSRKCPDFEADPLVLKLIQEGS
jgi:hypothetical protein